ncbi:MAG: 30S ribosomal protein S9 [Candidatus Marsarchaeota archaeon]|nr:30S ribosomal protein S9 [Candidatus Marsarchaeota archaeon]
MVTRAKRKEAIARAYIKAGKGRISVNGISVEVIKPNAARDLMIEPLRVSDSARDAARKLDILVNVSGGGVSAQAQAVRGAIAKGLVEFVGTESLKREFLNYDRSFLVDDPRRVEPKKFKGPKARARFQTSYR